VDDQPTWSLENVIGRPTHKKLIGGNQKYSFGQEALDVRGAMDLFCPVERAEITDFDAWE